MLSLVSNCSLCNCSSQSGSVLSQCLPGCVVNAKVLQGRLQGVLESFLLAVLGASTSLQISIEGALGKALVWHSGDVTSPVELNLAEHCEGTTDFCLLKDPCVRELVLPFHLEYLVKAVEVKAIQFLCMPLVHGPGLTCLEQDGEDDGSVDFCPAEFCRQAHPFTFPRQRT